MAPSSRVPGDRSVPPDPGTRPYGLDYVYMVVRRRVRLNARPPLKEVPLTRVGTRLPFEGGRDASDTSGAFEENEGLTGVLVAGGAAGVEGRLMTC